MPDEIQVPIPIMSYDITRPFVEGRAPIKGIKLLPSRSVPNGTMIPPNSPIMSGDFGLVDLNVGNWLGGIEDGWEMTALPVFSKRMPVYEYIFCRADRGIYQPKHRDGKRIGRRRCRNSTTRCIV